MTTDTKKQQQHYKNIFSVSNEKNHKIETELRVEVAFLMDGP